MRWQWKSLSPVWLFTTPRTVPVQFSSVQSLSRVLLFGTPWIAAHQAPPSITNSRVDSNPCPLSWWCHPTISFSAVPFSCPHTLPASGYFPMSQLFAWGGQSTGVSASASVLPVNTQDWSTLGYSPWNSPGQDTGVGSLSLLQGIFPTQGSNPGLLHCRRILYQLSHKGSPRILKWVAYPFSTGSFWSRNRTGVSCIAGRFFTNWAMREAYQ